MVLVYLLAVAFLLLYFFNQHKYGFWEKRGFKFIKPTFVLGNAGAFLTMKQQVGEVYRDIYNKYKKSVNCIGVYMFYRPQLVLTDPKLVQDVFIRDFTSFHDRPFASNEKVDPLSANLFNVHGQQWRDLRVKLSPTFTSGKLKGMFPVIKSVAVVLDEYLSRNVKTGKDVFEFRDLMARFNTNIISSVAFGIDNDCINEPDHIFRKMGAKIFAPSLRNALVAILFTISPELIHKLKFKLNAPDVEKFFFDVVDQTVSYREKNNYSRNDFMQLMIQLKNQGYVSVDKEGSEEKSDSDKISKLSYNSLVANAFLFFVAGFETSSSTMSFCLFELARHPEVQKKIQEEIERVKKTLQSDEPTYEMMNELKYLEACIDETLRKYPIVPILERLATRDYKFRESGLEIPKGTDVIIPVLAMQRDPEVYDDPLKFKPERFLDSANGGSKKEGLCYVPFGDGPRNCIGMRMGKLTTKIGLYSIMSKYTIEHTDKSMNHGELEFIPSLFVLTPKKAVNIKITPIS